ncbi:MAG: serine protease [Bacteroidales bacterium]|nr:serine protease [Bacteroidales bacterium]MCF8404359.1 serine protease [Bacteroidales bacterium]
MKKLISLLIVLFFIYQPGFSQFDPDASGKSLVRIMVTGSGNANVCSGFVWKKDEWIVTSLHAMKKNGKVQVQYLNKYWRDAKIIKTFPKADLVLLETNLNAKPLAASVLPIKSYSSAKVNFADKIYALGYHGGSEGYRTQSLEKGHAKPETIEYLVAKDESKQLVAHLGIPAIDLPILYLNGSLLPGYSGSPIYNTKGELIGIGDGGLESGQVNVSWAIPASYLDQLENSPTSSLPANIDQLDLLFSAKVEVKAETESPEEIQELFADEYESYVYGDFEFYYTKTRSFEDMYNSTLDPENLQYFVNDFTENNLYLNYNQLNFDIYEDALQGIILAVPAGSPLIYDQTNGIFQADLSKLPLGSYFALEFTGLAGDKFYSDVDMAVDDLLNLIDQAYGASVGGFQEDEDYSYSFQVDENRQMAYILFTGNNLLTNSDGSQMDVNMYLTVLLDDSKVFYTLSTIYIPVYDLGDAVTYGIDCVNYYNENAEYCDYFELLMHVIASTHLTTFANTSVVAKKR